MRLNILLILAVIILISLPLIIHSESEFAGTDDKATEIIEEVAPGYTPWTDNFWSPSSGLESNLFIFQAVLGTIFIGYYIAKKKFKIGSKKNASD